MHHVLGLLLQNGLPAFCRHVLQSRPHDLMVLLVAGPVEDGGSYLAAEPVGIPEARASAIGITGGEYSSRIIQRGIGIWIGSSLPPLSFRDTSPTLCTRASHRAPLGNRPAHWFLQVSAAVSVTDRGPYQIGGSCGEYVLVGNGM